MSEFNNNGQYDAQQKSVNPVQMNSSPAQQNQAGMQPNMGGMQPNYGNQSQPMLLSPEGSSLKMWMIAGLSLAVINTFANFLPFVGLITGIAEIVCVLVGMSKANSFFRMHSELGYRSFTPLMINYILSQVAVIIYVIVVFLGAAAAGAAANGQVSDQAALGFLGTAGLGLIIVLVYAVGVRIWALVAWIKTISLVR
jgi:uncharacterized membrane protein